MESLSLRMLYYSNVQKNKFITYHRACCMIFWFHPAIPYDLHELTSFKSPSQLHREGDRLELHCITPPSLRSSEGDRGASS